MKPRSLAAALAAASLIFAVASPASAVFIEGDLNVTVFSDLVDPDLVHWGTGFVMSASGNLSFLAGKYASVNDFYYQGPNVVLPAVILWEGLTQLPAAGSGPLMATAETIYQANASEILGTGSLELGGFEPTAMTWAVRATGSTTSFSVTAMGRPAGGAVPNPEPGAALLFGVGLLVVARAIRRS